MINTRSIVQEQPQTLFKGVVGPLRGVLGQGGGGQGPQADRQPLGLSSSHTSAHTYTIRTSQGGEVTQIEPPRTIRATRRGGGIRGKVRGLSRASRQNMMFMFKAIDQSKVKRVFWGTLTSNSLTWDNLEKRRKAWCRRFERRWGLDGWFMVWRKEPHESGAPHLHYLVYWLDKEPHLVNEFRPWNDKAWAAVQDNPEDARAGCQTQMIKSWKGVAHYISQYIAKHDDSHCPGRQWGVLRRMNYPVNWKDTEVQEQVGIKYQRTCRKLVERRRRFALLIKADATGSYLDPISKRYGWEDAKFQQGMIDLSKKNGWPCPYRIKWVQPRMTYRTSGLSVERVEDERGNRSWEEVPQPAWNNSSSRYMIKSQDADKLQAFYVNAWLKKLEEAELPF